MGDVDIAVVSNKFEDGDLRLKILDKLLEKFFFSPFEFHVLTEKQWKFYLRFIDEIVGV